MARLCTQLGHLSIHHFNIRKIPMIRERFLVKSSGDNPEGVRQGLVKTVDLLGSYQSAVVVVPTLGHLKDTILTNVLGPELSKKLIKDREILLPDGKKILLCGQATLKNFRRHEVYLDLWGSKYSIREIEALPCKAIVMVTCIPEDSAEWEQEHSVNIIYDDKNAGSSAEF